MLVWVKLKGHSGVRDVQDAKGVEMELSNGMVVRITDFEGKALIVTCPTGALSVRPAASNQVVLEQLDV